MNIQAITALVFSALALYGLWLLWTWLYRDYRIDLFRDRMFALRQELFDLAAQGVIPFNHPAYGALRTTMNGFIRLADNVNLTATLALALEFRGIKARDLGVEEFPDRWKRTTAVLDPEVRNRLDKIVDKMHFLVADQLIFTSTLLTLTIVPVALWMAVKRLMRGMTKKLISGLRPWIDDIDSEAHAAGSLA